MRSSPLFACTLLALSLCLAGCGTSTTAPEGADLATHCTTDKQCGGLTPRCELTSGRCVACLADVQCPAGEVCHQGACVAGCSELRTCATGVCDLDAGVCRTCMSDSDCASDAPRCDTSVNTCVPCLPAPKVDNCPAGEVCVAGDSGYSCVHGCKGDDECRGDGGVPTGACCNRVCVDTASNKGNCGTCGTTCDFPKACCSAQCNDFQSDPANCGGCAKACALANATAGCASGRCSVASCASGFADCNQIASDGCESNLASDVRNCGGCGMACAVPNAFASCDHGCGVAQCKTGFADCDKQPQDGCEIDLTSDPLNCGTCGTTCMVPHAAAGCVAGACAVAACNGTFFDCNMNPKDGCEVDTSVDVNNCGACGMACPMAPNGTAGCSLGNCAVIACAGSFADCDHMFQNGCETDTAIDAKNCGMCGKTCKLANATAACSVGSCVVAACAGTFADCDMMAGDGCEVDTSGDLSNCGACGNACGKAANGVAACLMGVCTATSCAMGFADCDKQFANGCEASLLTDRKNCGACGTVCSGQQLCQKGQCIFPYYGTGVDGSLDVMNGANAVLNSSRATAAGMAGQSTLAVNTTNGFVAGETVLVHQTQGTGAGTWELGTVASVGNNALTLASPLLNTYVTDKGTNHAQVLWVPQYTDVTVEQGGTMTAPAWDGNTGGILALQATGTVSISGAVTMDGAGFRGSTHACLYRCMPGFQGESPVGPGIASVNPNSSAGGGAMQGQDCGEGGGGSYGTLGTTGANGSGGACAPQPQLGGSAGALAGVQDLGLTMLFGGAGGEGGGDEDGARPGAGGNGGGIVVLLARTLVVTGTVHSYGANGGGGDSASCGAGGCGMGGGGGGAGGAIRVVSDNVNLLGSVTAAGGTGGACTCGGTAGGGGYGRIAIKSAIISGGTTPAYFGG